ncbi:ATP-binding protein [Dictyobacter vulcani]|uniref:ATP-binding protein n=1 Tax=Dictyobacter vulcani TaxID=2607529 RepID=UPI001E4D1FB1|nr:ATP-binding protein [Dictyobacter vulcani]
MRTPPARSSSTRRWGLGLAISKEIVERHEGQMWVESVEGKGTIFFVSLPAQCEPEKSP